MRIKLIFFICIILTSCSKQDQVSIYDSCLDYGWELLQDMQYGNALSAIDSCLAIDTHSDRGYCLRAIACIELRQFNSALEDLQKAYLIDSTSAFVLNNFGILYDRQHNDAKADYYYKKVIHYHPKYTAAYSNLGINATAAGKYRKALKFHNKAINLDSKDANVFINRGALYRFMGKQKKSLKDLNKAVHLADSRILTLKSHYHRGLTYKELNKTKKAIDDFTYAIDAFPYDHCSLYERGLLYYLTQDYDKALDDFQSAKKLGYDNKIDIVIEELKNIMNN